MSCKGKYHGNIGCLIVTWIFAMGCIALLIYLSTQYAHGHHGSPDSQRFRILGMLGSSICTICSGLAVAKQHNDIETTINEKGDPLNHNKYTVQAYRGLTAFVLSVPTMILCICTLAGVGSLGAEEPCLKATVITFLALSAVGGIAGSYSVWRFAFEDKCCLGIVAKSSTNKAPVQKVKVDAKRSEPVANVHTKAGQNPNGRRKISAKGLKRLKHHLKKKASRKISSVSDSYEKQPQTVNTSGDDGKFDPSTASSETDSGYHGGPEFDERPQGMDPVFFMDPQEAIVTVRAPQPNPDYIVNKTSLSQPVDI